MPVITWWLDVQLVIQWVHITDVVSSKLDQGDVYNIMWYSLSVTCGRSVVSSSTTIDCYEIAEILLKVALNTIILTIQIRYKATIYY
jgi:hypothetical protein